jgi:oligopeptide transport system substrate-binding protein
MDDGKTTASKWAAINSYALDRRRFLQSTLVVAGAAALAACTPGGGATGGASSPGAATGAGGGVPGPAWKGGIRGGNAIALWNDASLTYDPPLAYGRGDYYGLANVFRGMTFYGVDVAPELDIAESLDISDDGLTYTFTLRPGVKFHNGRTVVAEDFKWTYERSTSSEVGSWVQGFLSSVEGHGAFVDGQATEITGIVAEDDRTLVLKLTQPDVTILGVLGIPPFYVLPREEVERLGDKWAESPVGSGPYKLVSWDSGQRVITFERFEDYVYSDELPYLDTLEYRWDVTDDLAYLTVSKNEADLTFNIPPATIPRITQDPEQSKRFKEWGSFTLSWWEFDLSKAPFDNLKVRQAVNHAFNRERAAVLGYLPTGHFFPEGLLGFDSSAPIYDYDPEKAKSLLAESGVSDISFTLPVFGGGGSASRVAQLLQEDLKAVGITVELEQNDGVTPYDLGAQLPEQYRMWSLGWGMGLPDPSELISSLVGTDAPSNFNGYSNAEIDELGRQGTQETDRTKRGELYAEIERKLLEDAPYLFFGVATQPSMTSDTLQNFYFDPVLFAYLDRTWQDGS